MNILILSELFYPHGGGAELATYLYAKHLSEAKFSVAVVTNRFAGEPDFSKVDSFVVYRLPLFKKGGSVKFSVLKRVDVLFSSFMRKWIKWADIIYIPRYWFSAIPVAKFFGKPVISHLHDYIPICPLAKFYDVTKNSMCSRGVPCRLSCIYRSERNVGKGVFGAGVSAVLNSTVGRCLGRIVSFSDAVVCVSHAQRDLLVKWDRSLGRKVHVIPNLLPEISPVPLEGDDFGYFGGSSVMKGFSVLCRALGLLNSSHFVVHGTNFSLMNSRMDKSLERLGVKRYPRLNYSEMSRLYKQIKAVVVPSVVAEISPYVVTEAILRNRAVVASNIGGIPELVKGCRGVFLFDPGDYVQLSEKIQYLGGLSKERVANLCDGNREFLLKRFSNRETLQNFSDLCYKLVMNNHHV